MQNRPLLACVICIVVFSARGTALAHHGTPPYEDKITEFKQAKIANFSWANPHALVVFDAKYPDGTAVHMICETAAPQALRLIGWSKESLVPGDVVTVRMYVSKNGNPAERLNKIILADGTELHDTVLGGDAGNKTGYRSEDEPSGQK